ncbi:phosphoheptose isomerase [Rhodospirillum rubrum]|uniref:D-sedoheptulose 7-phosphate isomerase n=1 Tax=Rhodospirillum rubrum TaxID=1085 RepID=UPI0019075BC7|nr:D-sedoheptulose 7-phosphate isomerase [Rhodospirillum rubrum]MBK1665871.1 phosphoheptose isomerase [Rhodospirillum rubrum]MBK1677608.1 phosphoheptose isomerase [Rhodospirillum rubrum]
MEDEIRAFCQTAADCFIRLGECAPAIAEAAALVTASLRAGGKVMFCGNGGSAADAQHLAAELEGRYLKERAPLPGMALTTNTSTLTAVGNDYGFDHIFSRQVSAHGRPGDVLVALSTSGNSANVLRAIEAAREKGVSVIGLTGAGGGKMAEVCDLCLRVPSTQTPQIQQMHIAVGHLLCGLVEDALCS